MEKIKFGLNKYSGKSIWRKIQAVSTLLLILIFFFIFLPSLCIPFGLESVGSLHDRMIYIYNGMIVLNADLFLLFFLLSLFGFYLLIELMFISDKFSQGFYYHGREKDYLYEDKYINGASIWEEYPPK
jgi:hypothetical protein